jgi:hypothetical protein
VESRKTTRPFTTGSMNPRVNWPTSVTELCVTTPKESSWRKGSLDGRVVPVRFIGEQHVKEDCGFIPTVADWLKHIQAQPWMKRVGVKLSQTLEIANDGIRHDSTATSEASV